MNRKGLHCVARIIVKSSSLRSTNPANVDPSSKGHRAFSANNVGAEVITAQKDEPPEALQMSQKCSHLFGATDTIESISFFFLSKDKGCLKDNAAGDRSESSFLLLQ